MKPGVRFGPLLALATLAIDQASKLALLFVYDLPVREPVTLTLQFSKRDVEREELIEALQATLDDLRSR